MKINEDFKHELLDIKSRISNPNPLLVSNILLFKDYLNKMKNWYEKLQLEFSYDIMKNKDNNNLIIKLFHDEAVELIDIEFYRKNLLEGFNIGKNKYRSFDYLFIYLFIYWNLLIEKNGNPYKELPNPYEPVFKIIIRGGDIVYSEGFFTISRIDIGNNLKTLNLILPSLDDNFLDYIDSKCKLVGSDGIPNQERVNELWEEFQILNK